MAWLKSLTGTPSLPSGWAECNGQTISDSDSPFNGVAIPDLNGNSGTKRYLRGSTTSGATGGTETHSHGGATGTYTPPSPAGQGSYNNTRCYPHNHSIGADGTLPSYYEIVWIIRVK